MTRLAAVGFRCERIDRGGVRNLWARHGHGTPLICLAGHVDVVPPGPAEGWTSDPFVATEREGYLYGRGASDMKGPLAAMIAAAERFVAAHPGHAGSVALLLTSDEEGAAIDGTVAVVDALQSRGETIDACIVGEPTSTHLLGDTVKNGRRGSLGGALMVKGVQCHIAYPERGRNPIHAALPALAELVSVEWDRGNEHFPPTSFQLSNVRAGTGTVNVIPGLLEVLFNVRFSPESTVDGIKARVHAILDRHGLEYDVAWSLAGEPFMTGRGPLVSTLERAISRRDRVGSRALDEWRHLGRPLYRAYCEGGRRVRPRRRGDARSGRARSVGRPRTAVRDLRTCGRGIAAFRQSLDVVANPQAVRALSAHAKACALHAAHAKACALHAPRTLRHALYTYTHTKTCALRARARQGTRSETPERMIPSSRTL